MDEKLTPVKIRLLSAALGSVVAELRREVGLSQTQAEQILQYPKGWMSARERRKSEFKVSDLLVIAAGFNIHLLTLFAALMSYFGVMETLPEKLRNDIQEFAAGDIKRSISENSASVTKEVFDDEPF